VVVRFVPTSETDISLHTKKAPDHAGAFELLKFSRDQYLATTGPVQLNR
jgi:hypothetical protein